VAVQLAWVAAHLGVACDLRPLLQDRRPAWSLHWEVYPVLLWLRAKGYRCGLIANWDPGARRVISRLGLAALLQVVAVSSEVGAAKPDPRIFRAALAEAGVDPGEALYVGDDYRADVGGAWSAGMDALLVDRHPGWSPRRRMAPSADNLWGVVRRLLPGDVAPRVGRTA
jgi:FMN phosphatase YigB (HAD superfamily)